jgi:hypothetical protein
MQLSSIFQANRGQTVTCALLGKSVVFELPGSSTDMRVAKVTVRGDGVVHLATDTERGFASQSDQIATRSEPLYLILPAGHRFIALLGDLGTTVYVSIGQ